MQQRFCTTGEPTHCEGRLEDCPQCGDKVCEAHVVDGLCLACQDDESEETMEQPKKTLTYTQWGVISDAVCTAKTLLRSKIETYEAQGWDAKMYYGWMKETEKAAETLQSLASMIDWAQPETVVKLEVA